jgi:hypothetical protein
MKNPAATPPPLPSRPPEERPLPSPIARPDGAQVLDLPLDDLQDSPFQVKRYDDARVRDLAGAMTPGSTAASCSTASTMPARPP